MQTDEKIITGILNNNEKIMLKLYKTEYGRVQKMVYAFHSLALDTDDVFQEGLTRLIMNIRNGKFRGESTVSTYLVSICRNICLKTLSKNKKMAQELPETPIQEEHDNYYELLTLINTIKEKTGESCRTIIDLRFRQEMGDTDKNLRGFDEIAKQLNIESSNARQRFKRCLDKLREMVLNHPDYQTIKN